MKPVSTYIGFLAGFSVGMLILIWQNKSEGSSKIHDREGSVDNHYTHHHGSNKGTGTGTGTGSFDKMQRRFYKIAIGLTKSKSPLQQNTATPRKPYTLGAVSFGSGGLVDSDRLLLGQLYFNATSVFEFGLGESTTIAAYVGVPRFSGMDTDATWVSSARRKSSRSPNTDHFRFTFADIGETEDFGNPKNEKLAKIPLNSQTGSLSDEMEAFDVYLVDGRYRVACVCASMLHAMSRGGDMSRVKVAMHDWGRDHYLPVLEVGNLVHKSDRLAVLKVKPDATEDDIYKVWERHMWDKQ